MKPDLINELMRVYQIEVQMMINSEASRKHMIADHTIRVREMRSELSELLRVNSQSETILQLTRTLQSRIDSFAEQGNRRQQEYKKHKLQTTRMKGMLRRMNKEQKQKDKI
tara:strand:- start:7188 stop:7520 length:333 start_codon:yes stop_codon:yes gene_type:complete